MTGQTLPLFPLPETSVLDPYPLIASPKDNDLGSPSHPFARDLLDTGLILSLISATKDDQLDPPSIRQCRAHRCSFVCQVEYFIIVFHIKHFVRVFLIAVAGVCLVQCIVGVCLARSRKMRQASLASPPVLNLASIFYGHSGGNSVGRGQQNKWDIIVVSLSQNDWKA